MRNITKIKRSVRAISPVISVLLMIAIAVIAALVAYAWVMGYMGSQTGKADNSILLQSISYSENGNLVLYVQNTGQGTVHLKQDGSVYVNDVLKNILNVDGVAKAKGDLIPIAQGQTVTVEVEHKYKAGDRIRVVTVEGTLAETKDYNNNNNNQNGGVSVNLAGPSARFAFSPVTPKVAETVQFTDSSSAGSAVITSWLWSFGDSATSTQRNPTHAYSTEGVRTITLTVTDSNGNSSVTTKTISVEANPNPAITAPTAEFTMSPKDNVAINQNVQFTDTSTAGTGTITSWSWNFGDGTTSTERNPTHAYSSVNQKTVTLTVTDTNQKTSTASHTINVVPAPLTAAFAYAPSSPIVNEEVSFLGTATGGSGTVTSWSWIFGDGSTSTAQNPTHIYLTSGSKQVTLTVTDSDGATDTETKTISIRSATQSNKLAFVTSAQNLLVNTPEKITIQRQNSVGTPITIGATTVTLNATGGTIYSDAACTTPITEPVTINYAASTFDFYYKCPTVGEQTLTATAPSYQGASKTLTINAQPVTTYTITYEVNNDDYGTVNPSGTVSGYLHGASVTITATPNQGYVFKDWTRNGDITIADEKSAQTNATIQGDGVITANFKPVSTDKLEFTTGVKQYLDLNQGSAAITVQRQTQSGTPITTGTTNISLVSTSSGGTFHSGYPCTNQNKITTVTIGEGKNAAIFYYKDSSTGTPTISASAEEFATAQTYFNINSKCTGFETYQDKVWYYGFAVDVQPPFYRGIGLGVDGTDCAMSDSNDFYYDDNGNWHAGTNDGAFTANSLNIASANTVTITFQYKLVNTNDTTDFRIGYSTVTNPNLSVKSPSFTYTNLGTTNNDGQWHTYTVTFTRGTDNVFRSTSSSAQFSSTTTFWFRFESILDTRGSIVESVYVDNVIISLS